MNIGSYSLTENMWNFYRANQVGDYQKTSFRQMAGKSESPLGSSYDLADVLEPRLQIMQDYRGWKAKRPFTALPLSRGRTAENFEYLEKKYGSKRLTVFERIEAMDTMRELGMIDENQMLDALGLGENSSQVLSDKYSPDSYTTGINHDAKLDEWTEFFAMSSIGWADTLPKLFELLNARLRFDGEEDLAEEIQSVLNQVTSKKAF